MEKVIGLRCKECARSFPPVALHVCEYCFGPLEVIYDYEYIRETLQSDPIISGPKSMWRYKDLLPCAAGDPIDLGAGYTPLVKADRLASLLGLRDLYLKDDTRNPTGSFKDRVVSVALTKARELGFKVAACASTGNLANAVAAHAARAGMQSFVFIPQDLEEAKIITSAVYGCNLIAINGNYDDVNRLCAELASEHESWAFVNVNVRPYYAEGSKTLAFEISEQLNWTFPDHVVVPVASGSQLTKINKGFEELFAVGLVKEAPQVRISGAQAEGCAPVASAYQEGRDFIKPVKPNTIAKSLAIGDPADGYYALEIVRETGGVVECVTDEEIVEAIRLLAVHEGIFAETAGGVTVGSLIKMVNSGQIGSDEKVVAIISGHGLKTAEVLKDKVRPTVTISADLDEFENFLAGNEKENV